MIYQREYHYLIAGLPDIVIGQSKVALKVADFKAELQQFLHPEDFQLLQMLFLRFDNQNLLYLLQKSEAAWDPMGRFSQEELLQGLEDDSTLLPSYLQVFAQAYREGKDIFNGMGWENQLTWLYYDYVLSNAAGFLADWFTFERDFKNILAALSARRHGLSSEGQLIGNNPVTEALRKSHARDFGLSQEYPFVDKLLKTEEQTDLLERERIITQLKWNQIDEMNTFHYFTIDRLLGFMLKLISYERWSVLDPDQGREVLEEKVIDLERSFVFLKEFEL
jgi:hypothetical protein